MVSTKSLFGGLIGLLLLCPAAVSAQTVVWDPNTESDIAGYRLYYGTESKTYTKQIDVGNRTSYSPPGVDWTKSHFFAVQAYTTSGVKSPLSAEVKWTPPVASPTTITSLTASATSPFLVGKTVTWTASAVAKSSVEYRFWMYRSGAWKLAQEYGSDNTFSWTPAWDDTGGPYYLQVWVRSVGSTADYEAWTGTEPFSVVGVPIEIAADVDFPTPPDNPVTWKVTVAEAESATFEYKFWIYSEKSKAWAVLRDYGPSNEAVWVPEAVGKYAVQGWARRVGSTKPYDVYTGRYANVARTALEITRFSGDMGTPVGTGQRMTWTARVKGGTTGPLEYQFWVYSPAEGWMVGQPYGPSKVFRWTPRWGQEGQNALQVWVRNAGSAAQYEAWTGTGLFDVRSTDMHLTTTSLFPIGTGNLVKWFAEAAPTPSSYEYQFWVYSSAAGRWSLGKPYGPEQTFAWTPAIPDSYAIQAWARLSGSSAPYDKYRGSGYFKVSSSSAQISTLVSDVQLPVRAGKTVKWTAAASGGTAQLEYQFWRWDSATGWIVVQTYSPKATYAWTTTSADVGTHAIQVWVRSAGSTSEYEAYMGTGTFVINP